MSLARCIACCKALEALEALEALTQAGSSSEKPVRKARRLHIVIPQGKDQGQISIESIRYK